MTSHFIFKDYRFIVGINILLNVLVLRRIIGGYKLAVKGRLPLYKRKGLCREIPHSPVCQPISAL